MIDKREIIIAGTKRLDAASDADRPNRLRGESDMQMLIGNQWPVDVKAKRDADGQPCLTINKMPSFVRQVTGQIRSLNPAIEVLAADGEADDEISEVYAGLIRHIENDADATSVYEQGAESAAACGIGHWRVQTKFSDGDTFDQEIEIKRVYNPNSVFWDPFARHPTRKDAEYCFIIAEMPKADFEAEYPGVATSDITSSHKADTSNYRYSHTWFTPDSVTVAEYFWIEKSTHKIYEMQDGSVVTEFNPPEQPVRSRDVEDRKVMWVKMTGRDVLEGPTEFPAKHIPVISVTGEEWHLGEEMYRSSVIRFAKDAQQLYNYSRSAHAEMVSLQPKAPYIGTVDQFAGLGTIWATANSKNRPYLPYNPDPKAPGAPQRQSPPVASSGLMQEMAIAADDMKSTTGIFDASLGNTSNEKSGVAIQRRQMESQNGTSIYADNLVKAILHTGGIIAEMIPRVYDTQRTLRILNSDNDEKKVVVNLLKQTQEGVVSVNDMTKGKYDVVIRVGPSHETKREAAADGMIKFIAAVPQAAAITGDLIAKAQDWPDSDKFADRLRKTLPPGMIEEDEMTPEEKQAQQQAQGQAQQEQAEAKQIALAKVKAGIDGDTARAAKDDATAQKTQLEAAQLQFELAIKSGMLDGAIQQAVSQALHEQIGQMQQQIPVQPGIPIQGSTG